MYGNPFHEEFWVFGCATQTPPSLYFSSHILKYWVKLISIFAFQISVITCYRYVDLIGSCCIIIIGNLVGNMTEKPKQTCNDAIFFHIG
uniref:Uncharacterized protein n=1 Tax=Oryza brachyantha TaxID=4533 RepID=J3MTB5_ORYBR